MGSEAILVLGSQFGDEGKGKLIDIIAAERDICIRAQGGHNAGHTIVHGDLKFNFHLLPSGLLHPKCINLVGSGCVVHVPSLLKELASLDENGIQYKDRLFLSDRCHVDFDLHHEVDGLSEVELGKSAVGTTRKGIGPTYSNRADRSGAMLVDIFDDELLETKLRRMADGYRKRYGDLLSKYDVEEEIARFKTYREKLADLVRDEVPLLRSAKAQGLKMVVEGAQAAGLDIAFGTYPFVTSSNCSVGGMLAGVSIGWNSVKEVIGVVKAYATRVGGGPFLTEQLNKDGDKLQSIGKEFGVTTGRRRRTGWLDLVQVLLAHEVNSFTALNLTKLDVLDTFEEIQVGIAYTVDGTKLDSFPAGKKILDKVQVKYQTFRGWKTSTTGVTKWEELPKAAQEYLEFIEQFVGVKIKYIGTGPGREHMIVR
ncbi:Adenylosuccinate synthetase [Elaphomyces granulatus]